MSNTVSSKLFLPDIIVDLKNPIPKRVILKEVQLSLYITHHFKSTLPLKNQSFKNFFIHQTHRLRLLISASFLDVVNPGQHPLTPGLENGQLLGQLLLVDHQWPSHGQKCFKIL
jgi:hypothetical protein